MKSIKEENYDIICKRIQELIDLLEKEASTMPQDKWDDIISRITRLNKMLEQLGRK